MIHVEFPAGHGPRCFIGHRRVHHGLTGVAILAAGIASANALLVIAGAALIAHDLRDRRVWIRDLLATRPCG